MRLRSFAMYYWIFMRISGVLLLFLALGHLIVMHIVNAAKSPDSSFVIARWTNPFWRLYDGLLLLLGLWHGTAGLITVTADHISRPKWRRACQWGIFFMAVSLFALGVVSLALASR